MANRCNLAPLKNFQIDRPKIHHIFPHPNLNRFLRFSFKLDNSAWTNIDRTKLETAHHRATAEMLKDDFPLASRFALGCDTIGNRCWQTDDDSVALSAAHPKSSSFPSSRSFISCFPPSVRKVHSDGSGQRAISMPVDQSPHPTAKLEKRWSVCVCVCVTNEYTPIFGTHQTDLPSGENAAVRLRHLPFATFFLEKSSIFQWSCDYWLYSIVSSDFCVWNIFLFRVKLLNQVFWNFCFRQIAEALLNSVSISIYSIESLQVFWKFCFCRIEIKRCLIWFQFGRYSIGLMYIDVCFDDI